MTPAEVPLDRQIAEVRRELAMRRRAYPRFVANGTITPQQAEQQMVALAAALATLEGLQAQRNPQGGLAL